MISPLEKAHQYPDSMKAKILMAAKRIFGLYGFHGTTTRMIARDVGIDVSTLYYHWGEKGDLYEAVVLDTNEALRRKFVALESEIHNFKLSKRIELAINPIVDYLFEYPEITNLILSRYFVKIRHRASQNLEVPEYISNIAYSMGLSEDRHKVPVQHKLQLLAITNALYVFVSGAVFFQESLKIKKDEYIRLVKKTVHFIMIPAFVSPIEEDMKKMYQKDTAKT